MYMYMYTNTCMHADTHALLSFFPLLLLLLATRTFTYFYATYLEIKAFVQLQMRVKNALNDDEMHGFVVHRHGVATKEASE